MKKSVKIEMIVNYESERTDTDYLELVTVMHSAIRPTASKVSGISLQSIEFCGELDGVKIDVN